MNLSGYHYLFSWNLKVFENFSQLSFSVSSRVYLSSVEVIDAILETNLNDLPVFLVVFMMIVDHVAHGDG